MTTQRLTDFLDSHDVRYEVLNHATSYTAQGTAQSAHIPGKELAKTVIVEIDGQMAMAVLPACYQVDLELLRKAAGAKEVKLAHEQDFKESFPECEPGAMPPFGNLYDMRVFSSPQLAKDEEIAFNAGTHEELIRISYKDFTDLVSPVVTRLSSADRE